MNVSLVQLLENVIYDNDSLTLACINSLKIKIGLYLNARVLLNVTNYEQVVFGLLEM